MLLDSGLCQCDKSIVITEPRKISAITLATRVAQEQKTNLGQLVGYSVRFDNCSQPSTKIKVSFSCLMILIIFCLHINTNYFMNSISLKVFF